MKKIVLSLAFFLSLQTTETFTFGFGEGDITEKGVRGGTFQRSTESVANPGGALLVRTQADYLEIPHISSYNTSIMTIEMWVRRGSTPIIDSYNGLLGKGGNSNLNFFVVNNYEPQGFCFGATDNSGGSVQTCSYDRLWPGIWYHLAASYDGARARLFLNGQQVDSSDGIVDISQTSSALFLGRWVLYSLAGEIDELRIWNIARSQSDIAATMHSELSGTEPGLIGYWKFDDLGATTVRDHSANQNHGTLKGSAEVVPSSAPTTYVPPPSPGSNHATAEDARVVLEWSPVTTGSVERYVIYRSAVRNFVPSATDSIGGVSHPAFTFVDQSVVPRQMYYYRIAAVDAAGNHGFPTNTILARPGPALSDYVVGVYYYPWYYADRWPGQYLRGQTIPPQPPMLGEYDSRDTSVIRQQLRWSEEYGIDLWVMSYWSRTFNRDLVNLESDSLIRYIYAPMFQTSSVRFSLFYEIALFPPVLENEKEQQWIDDFKHMASTYFCHPNYFRINERPVVFLYAAHAYTGNVVQTFSRMRDTLMAMGHNVYLIGDEIHPQGTFEGSVKADALTAYVFPWDLQQGEYPVQAEYFTATSRLMDRWKAFGERNGKIAVPAVVPGINSRANGNRDTPGNIPLPNQARADGSSISTFEESIRSMRQHIDDNLKLIMITSWNEWYEDTQIEPAIVAPPTSQDNSSSGTNYTMGYSYEGYGFRYLETIRSMLGGGITGVEDGSTSLPDKFSLMQNYPNPFNPSTTISFSIPSRSFVSLRIFDALGREVATLTSEELPAGIHSRLWNAKGLASGFYFYRLQSGAHIQTKKLLLLK